MYDRTIGCQVRTVRDVKADEAALSVPIAAMVTPDLIASSDAGRAIFACVRTAAGSSSSGDDPNRDGDGGVRGGGGFWGAFGPTGKLEQAQAERIHQNSGTQLLVKILQERKRVETALARHERMIAIENGGGGGEHPKAQPASAGSISYRAPYLAFLIHQRFANDQNPRVVAATRAARGVGGTTLLPPRPSCRGGRPPPSRPTSEPCRRRSAPPYAGSGTSSRYSRGASPACRPCRTSQPGPCCWRRSSRRSSRRVCRATIRRCSPPA